MIRDLWLVGIGTGNPAHLTLEGADALRNASAILLPHKGDDKDGLVKLRQQILTHVGAAAPVLPFDYPVRDESLPYDQRVSDWHDEIARRWQGAVAGQNLTGPVALLVWGDPSLYDSTLRIADRLDPKPNIRVIPGITAIQALTAAHAIPLNDINGPVTITTGRRLRSGAWPDGAQSLIVMLDGELSFRSLPDPDLHIWWGAYLGSPDQILLSGPAHDIADQIAETRATARQQHGWIMDTYLLKRR